MKRMERRASAAMRSASALLRSMVGLAAVAEASRVRVDIETLLTGQQTRVLCCVVEADLLQLGQRAGGAGDQDSAVHQMVGQFRGKRVMRKPVRIDVELDEGCCLFPDRVVAGHENHTPPHQRRYWIVLARE